ncbi:MAG TPA: UTP--glucose-1-phosphate uridylyltransferase [Acholeplasmataceae bacterium]|nr:MAG: UTP--glucose-1-phosphate uridylyltransferase [Tenericutes bacterium GWC2_39_45]OHE38809.1 MAG: UTP--glucose-1-phosphate uridylyltransferase [Tenericutes bacterium GWE2_38_8]HBG33494.1 UTP--glucose-1-phosphate uridylyltransferase [Acholeplasmataceae bacterium]HBY65182.1 UTP--glucose-1-phosphate uridylyltransferase [Acholeplasmataceae bacterium]HCB66118.1 UTP--glucose-1-phosphate uridylyltransferase [Acholeplasmataceae bacterium]
MIKKAVIPAAGYGTRFLPITKALPKELLPIIDHPTIEYIVNEAIESGITDILLIVSSNKNAIIDYFDYNLELETILLSKNKYEEYGIIRNIAKGANIHYIRQREQLGLGHAVLQAEAFVGNEPFAVLLGDDMYVGKPEPAMKQLMDAYEKVQSTVLGTIEVELKDTSKYGICIPKPDQKGPIVELKGVVEKPKVEEAPSRSAIGGRYILTPGIFSYLKNQTRGAGNEIQLTDAILRLMGTEKVFSYDITGKRYDVGNKMDYIEAILDFGLQKNEMKDELQKLINKKAK